MRGGGPGKVNIKEMEKLEATVLSFKFNKFRTRSSETILLVLKVIEEETHGEFKKDCSWSFS